MTALPPPGTGYFVAGDTPGPGLLLLHSPWGLTPSVRARADELADLGYTVLAPDLNDGFVATDNADAIDHLMRQNMNVTASLVQSSLRLVQQASADPSSPVGLVGWAAGASWALWASERLADRCCAVVSFYGTQQIDFDDSQSDYLLHVGSDDTTVTDDDLAGLGLNLQLARRPFRLVRHEGAGHGFAESGADGFSPSVDAIAWRQTLEFLAGRLRSTR